MSGRRGRQPTKQSCRRCGLPAAAPIHTGGHPGRCHAFEGGASDRPATQQPRVLDDLRASRHNWRWVSAEYVRGEMCEVEAALEAGQVSAALARVRDLRRALGTP